ncbi:MAG: TPM domain-containing protein [Myxococcales bacterium]
MRRSSCVSHKLRWKLGRKDADDGVLILVVSNDRKMRIEVGYGLEGALPDVAAGRIIRDLMAPQFKRGDYDAGINAAVDAIMRATGAAELAIDEAVTEENPGALRASKGLQVSPVSTGPPPGFFTPFCIFICDQDIQST